MQHADHYLTPLGIACRIDGPNHFPEITLRAGIRHEVALAFKEALQNIVKHAAASEVELTLRQEIDRIRACDRDMKIRSVRRERSPTASENHSTACSRGILRVNVPPPWPPSMRIS